ncbi:MAG: amino acid ABC transporter permease [Clostridia bacterium]|nr:amino acid ABC transporter permease [Clostridia bacterium]MEE1116474.1 amino acid ABC transporter permease [Clostridia bacterium]
MEGFLSDFLRLLGAFSQSLIIFSFTLVIAIPLGVIICSGSMSKVKVLRAIVRGFIAIIRGTPLMLQLILVCYGPSMIFSGFSWRVALGQFEYWRIVIAIMTFGVNYACYFSEIFRGGILSIPQGQTEAGKVLGFTKTQIFFKVTLLQVINRIVPPMSNEIITLVKDTSLAQIIMVAELTYTTNEMSRTSGGSLWPLLAAGAFYFCFNAIVTVILSKLEKKLSYIKA